VAADPRTVVSPRAASFPIFMFGFLSCSTRRIVGGADCKSIAKLQQSANPDDLQGFRARFRDHES
jgi:hypothetical protein